MLTYMQRYLYPISLLFNAFSQVRGQSAGGSSGVPSASFIPSSGVPNVPPPSTLSSNLSLSLGSSAGIPSGPPPGIPSAGSSVLLPTAGTVLVATISSTAVSEQFIPTTFPGYATLTTTISTTSLDAQSNPITVLIGPSGVAWTPTNQPSGAPEVPPPSIVPSQILPQTTQSSGIVLPTITTSYDPGAVTILSIDPTITGNTVIRTSDDHHTLGLYPFIKGGPGCFFCPPGLDNGGFFLFGMNLPGIFPPPTPPPFPKVKNWPTIKIGNDLQPTPDPGNKDQPSTQPTNSADSTATSTGTPSSSETSSCSASTIASDCSVLCSATSGSGSSQSCSTSCFSTVTGCSTVGTTITSTTTRACQLLLPFSNIVDGSDYAQNSAARTANPSSAASRSAGTITGSVSAIPTGNSTSQDGSGGTSSIPPTSTTNTTTTASTSSSSDFCPATSPASSDPQIPGCWGVPGCAYYLASEQGLPADTPNYCNCGGTTAPLLTSDGTTDCFYSTQPASNIPLGTLSGVSTTSASVQPSTSPPSTSAPPSSSTVASTTSSPVSITIDTFPCTLSEVAPLAISNGVGAGSTQDCWCNFDGGSNAWSYGGTPGDNCCDNACSACTNQCRDTTGGPIFPPRRRELALGKDRPRQISSKNLRRDFIAKAHAPAIRKEPWTAIGRLFDVRELKDHQPKWQFYAPKGLQLYKDWTNKNGADAQDPCNFDDYFKLQGPTKAKLSETARKLLSDSKDNKDNKDITDSVYLSMVATGPKGNDIADFTVTISASAGVFLANAIDRGARPEKNPPQNPIPYHFSQVAWWMWVRTVKTENPKATDFSGINSFWQRDVDNADTVEILNEIFAGKDITETLKFDPSDESLDNAFWPLLGSPNGNGMQYFLTDHKVATHGKGIKRISVTTDKNKIYQMWATIE